MGKQTNSISQLVARNPETDRDELDIQLHEGLPVDGGYLHTWKNLRADVEDLYA